MKVLISFFVFMTFLNFETALAATHKYGLKMVIKVNGKELPLTSVIVNEGEMASVIQKTDDNRNFVEVTTKSTPMKDAKGVIMKFTIGTIGENSKRTITSTPTIIAKEGAEAMIAESDKTTGRETLQVKVTAQSVE
jgi:ribosomal protein S4